MTKDQLKRWAHTQCKNAGLKHFAITKNGLEVLSNGERKVHKLNPRMKSAEMDVLSSTIRRYGSVSHKWDGTTGIR